MNLVDPKNNLTLMPGLGAKKTSLKLNLSIVLMSHNEGLTISGGTALSTYGRADLTHCVVHSVVEFLPRILLTYIIQVSMVIWALIHVVVTLVQWDMKRLMLILLLVGVLICSSTMSSCVFCLLEIKQVSLED